MEYRRRGLTAVLEYKAARRRCARCTRYSRYGLRSRVTTCDVLPGLAWTLHYSAFRGAAEKAGSKWTIDTRPDGI